MIDTAYLADVLARLLAIPSPSGYTDNVVRACCDELTRLGVPFEITRRGAIRALLAGREHRPARALVAHLDTLGAQVRALKDNGRLELVPIGTWSARFAEGARVTILSDPGSYRGTILPLKSSGHAYGDAVDTQPIGWDHVEVRVDATATSREELEKLGIEIGDVVAVDPQPEFLDNGYIVSRHLDDKAGVALLLAAIKALKERAAIPAVDTYFVFSITEEIGVGAAAVLTGDIASMVTIDNGTTAPNQNSREFGVTIAMADMSGPFDYHLTHKLIRLCAERDIRHQRDVFRYYRSDSASAITAGHDVRTALITFGVDSSHGYERIHMHALRSVAELALAYAESEVEISRDAVDIGPLKGFTRQPSNEAEQSHEPADRAEDEATEGEPAAQD